MSTELVVTREPLTDSEIRTAAAVELFPVLVALLAGALSVGLWAYYSATGNGINYRPALFIYAVLALAFLFSGFGWTLVGRSGVGCAVILLRLAVVLVSLPIAGVTARGSEMGGAAVAISLTVVMGILVSVASAVAIARTESLKGRRPGAIA